MTAPFLFPIGTEISCDCGQKCGITGTIIGYNMKGEYYILAGGDLIAFFATARKLSKLELAMK